MFSFLLLLSECELRISATYNFWPRVKNRRFPFKMGSKSTILSNQGKECDIQAILSITTGMLLRKNSKNQKKQSVQLFCQKTVNFPSFAFNLVFPALFHWKMGLSRLISSLGFAPREELCPLRPYWNAPVLFTPSSF